MAGNFRLTTPVAFFIFNRPETTERVFNEIARAKPPKLLVVGDAARSDRPAEAGLVADTRAIIDQVDWNCEVLTNFSEQNLGCKRRISSGIDCVFEQVEEAIMLEDDCLPDPSFFRFCQEMLERYRGDRRIGMISGDNFQLGRGRNEDSYYFSKYIHIWGWASWRDRWVGNYDVAMAKWPNLRATSWLADRSGSAREASYWRSIFDRVHRGEIDTWDYQWAFANWTENRMSILPALNIISNIGFGASATHTKGTSDLAGLAANEIEFPLKHPRAVARDHQADAFSERRWFRASLAQRIRNGIIGDLFKAAAQRRDLS